jgi:hypothetical protein
VARQPVAHGAGALLRRAVVVGITAAGRGSLPPLGSGGKISAAELKLRRRASAPRAGYRTPVVRRAGSLPYATLTRKRLLHAETPTHGRPPAPPIDFADSAPLWRPQIPSVENPILNEAERHLQSRALRNVRAKGGLSAIRTLPCDSGVSRLGDISLKWPIAGSNR